MAPGQCRPCQPRPTEDVADRELPHGGARRPCRALRGVRARQISDNSCRNRHCPKCQGAAAKDWLAAREADLLPVPYYHVVFTLPAAIADIAYQNKAVIYDLLFKVSAETMLTIAADPKHLGARIGITSVLHTWGSAMTHHPHVHMIVPGGGISLDGERWVACRPGFFLPVRVLSRLFRRLFLERLIATHKANRLKFFGGHVALADTKAFAAYRTAAPNRMGRLCQAPVRRPTGRAGLSVALYPPCRHRQQPANRLRPLQRDLPMEGLSCRGSRLSEGHDTRYRRVHPGHSDPRPAVWLPPHPPLRPARQSGTRADNIAQRAACSTCLRNSTRPAMTVTPRKPNSRARAAAAA